MLKVIVEKEMRDTLRSTKFVITFSVCLILILLSFYVGANNYKSSMEQYRAAQTENLRQFEGLTDWINLQQFRVFLPPQPLASLVSGISNDIGRTIEIRGRGELQAHDSRFNDEPIYAVFRFLDLEFLFGIVLSLFAILLGYDAICGEKERGTLRLSFANPVPRATYIGGKLIGSFLALAVPLVIAFLIGALFLPLLKVPLAGTDWLKLILITFTGLLYFGAFLTLSIFVSALTHRTSSSFLLLLVIWVVSALIIPRASVLLAGRAVEVPSVDEIQAQKNRFISQLWQEDKQKMADFKPDDTEDIENLMSQFNKFMDEMSDAREAKVDEFSSRLNEERYNRQKVQEKLALNLARISPMTSMTCAASELAGTSLHLKNRYIDEAQAYQKIYGAFIKEKTGINPGSMLIIQSKSDDDEEVELIDPNELPKFEYQSASLAEVIGNSIVDMGLLAILNLLFFAGAFLSFTRYDLR